MPQVTQNIVSDPPSNISTSALVEKLLRQVLFLSLGYVSILKPTSGPVVNGANGNSGIKELREEILITTSPELWIPEVGQVLWQRSVSPTLGKLDWDYKCKVSLSFIMRLSKQANRRGGCMVSMERVVSFDPGLFL